MRTPSMFLNLALVAAAVCAVSGCQIGRDKPVAKPVKQTKTDYNRPLAPGESALREADIASVPDISLAAEDRARLQTAINHSLAWLAKPDSDLMYPVAGVTKDQVVRSLQALGQMLRDARDQAEFNAQLKQRFRALMSVGCDSKGTVLFTGYCTPILPASTTATATFRYPVYKRPADLVAAPPRSNAIAQQQQGDGTLRQYPTRGELESSGALKGLELVYFKDPYDAYVVEVQGSAKVMLTDGQIMEIGYNGTNGHPYHALGQDLVSEGKIAAADLSLPTIRAYFKDHPDELPTYKARNPRFVFFAKTSGGPYGSLGKPVTRDVTVATDKSIFPPGAACLAATSIAAAPGHQGTFAALRLDQDTGGGIRAAGRCDLYMGEGDVAERRAGNQLAEGRLYYLLLKE